MQHFPALLNIALPFLLVPEDFVPVSTVELDKVFLDEVTALARATS